MVGLGASRGRERLGLLVGEEGCLRAGSSEQPRHPQPSTGEQPVEQGRDGEVGEKACGFEDQGLEGAQPLPQWVVCGLTAPTAGSCL